MSPAPVFAEVLQRQRTVYTEGVMSGAHARLLERPSPDRRLFRGSFLLGVRDWSKGVRLCFEATEAGLRAEVING